jgi:iron complex outermembrane receptor protein
MRFTTKTRNKSFGRHALLLSAGLMSLVASPAFAQDAPADPEAAPQDSGGIAEIIVTAQKRSENVQDVPIAITAVSGETLTDRNITDVQSLAKLVPGVVFSATNGEARISIRGVSYDGLSGGSAESRAAYHLDGVYLATTGEIFGTFYDVERTEALRGPQGTLFGRNAISGSLNVITREPTNDAEGYLQADIGNYDRVVVQGGVGGPLAEGVSARIAFKTENRSGYEYNPLKDLDLNNVNTRAIRGKLKLEPTENFTVVVSADYFRERDRQGFIFFGVSAPELNPLATGETLGGIARDGNPRHDFSDYGPRQERDYWGLSANATLNLNDNFDLVSITSYRKGEERTDFDVDGTSANLAPGIIENRINQFSEELRLQGDFDRFNFIVGGYLFTRDFFTDQRFPVDAILFGNPTPTGLLDGIHIGGTVETLAVAGFAEATYELTDWFSLTAGARYSWERKKRIGEFFSFNFGAPFNPDVPAPLVLILGPPITSSDTYKNFSPRVTATAKLNDDTSIYATFSKGFRSGGFNLGYNTPGFRPETLTNFEGGLKTELFDRHLRLNAAGFYYDYTDLQVSKADAFSNTIQNAAAAKLYGAELEVLAIPVDGLQIDASASITKSEFTEFDTFDPARPALGTLDLSGNRLPQAPKYTLSYGAQYTTQTDLGEFTLRAEGRSISNIFFDQFNRTTNGERAFTIVNAFVNWKSDDGKLYGSVYVRNIGDVLAKNGSLTFAGFTGYNIEGNYEPPRTYGITLGVNF